MPEPRIQFADSEPDMLELMADPPQRALAAQDRSLTVATPAHLLQIAVERGADLAYVEKLMQLQERWEGNEARKAYNAAFSAFKAEAVAIYRTKTITDGPLKGKSHAELGAIVQAVTPALSKHGLSLSWRLSKDEKDWIEVTATLRHVAGHSESVSMGGAPDAGPGRNAIQARGSVKTYLERYTGTAILGLAAQDADDDGAGGGDPPPPAGRGDARTPEPYPQASFDKNLPAWRQLIADGTKTADRLIAFIESRGQSLTDEQKQRIKA